MRDLLKYILKRLVSIEVTVAIIVAVGYTLIYFSPGQFFNAGTLAAAMSELQMSDPAALHKIIAEFDARYGLNVPFYQQVANYVWHSLTFNFGNSFESPMVPIIHQLEAAFPVSAELAFGAVALGVVVGVPLGVLAALKRNTWWDYIVTGISMFGQAIPSFVLAVFVVLLFGVVFVGVLPVNGWGTPAQAILPIFCLGAGNIAVVTRYMRNSLIETLRQDYIRTAEAKGVKYWHRIIKHGVRNSVTALITVMGPAFAFTVVGTVWVENVFSIPGMGTLMANAFVFKDVPLAIVSIYILSMLVLVINLLVDLTYKAIDPRVKLE
jgi:peptide/nickel transport system permease protein